MAHVEVRIRPFRQADAPQILQAVHESAAGVPPWMPALDPSITLGQIESYIETQQWLRADKIAYNMAIVDAHDGSFLGGCGLTQVNWRHRFANLYYWVRSSRTGHGIATAATCQLARFGLETLELQRIEIVVATTNHASIRVAQKAGATREGLLRNRLNLHGQIHDAFMYSLIAGDA